MALGDKDVYLIKTDAHGEKEWSRTFGGAYEDRGLCVQQGADGGFIVAGWTESFRAGEWHLDIYLIKTYRNGKKEWSTTFADGCGRSVQQTTDGGFVVAGYTGFFGAGDFDVYLIKTDANGREEWSRTFGGAGMDLGHSVQQTTDGGFVVAGSTEAGEGNSDIYLLKTYPNGEKEWDRTFGGADSDFGRSVQQTSDGGFIIAGGTMSFGAYDAYLIKSDGKGNEQWTRRFRAGEYQWGQSVQQTTDGGFIIAGRTASSGAAMPDVYLIKTDRYGNAPGVCFDIVMPVDGLPGYSAFPSDDWEEKRTADPRSWYSVVYRGRYSGSWEDRDEGSGSHPGVDIRVASGTPVKAICNGTVWKSYDSPSWGGLVIIKHTGVPNTPGGQPIWSVYAHLKRRDVSADQQVSAGQVIGLSGGALTDPNHGTSTSAHLHFQIDRDNMDDGRPFASPYWPNTFYYLDIPKRDPFKDKPDQNPAVVEKFTYNPIKFIEDVRAWLTP